MGYGNQMRHESQTKPEIKRTESGQNTGANHSTGDPDPDSVRYDDFPAANPVD
jgi:hypothetical protein